MIVRETPASFIYLTQHDHAQVAAVLAQHWRAEYFEDAGRRPEVELAVRQHDRAWIPLDAAPIWNETAHRPHSFLDYPAPPKVQHYQQGLDETEQLSPYAALLCSLHYTSFPDVAKHEAGRHFLAYEAQRQQRLRHQLSLTTLAAEATLTFHLHLLKFCDNLSLYLCLNEPGVSKAREYPWFTNGIPLSDFFAFTQGTLVQASWATKNRVQITPSPFARNFPVTLRYRELPKDHVSGGSLAAGLERASWQKLDIWIATEPDSTTPTLAHELH
ncbi:DUF3891 family protein [Hymenobacter sp. HSC-4F20]|uniref:DUF3891 family protein n=1 Tax=Hymenobacter sp. HSC-4F20 TaxID=2864135 RepID=UPI001C72E68E|nr:DUF3891 family protein [Hymenobacter sp. HSC-4F20]MBX0292375.1 DUF3891 family protein [Hymenobacter sp. HSC-4F20]